MSEYYRILSIDYGKKRIGLAMTDLMRVIVSPYKTIDNKGIEDFVSQMSNICIDENVRVIVLGCPTLNNQNKELVAEINEISLLLNEVKSDIKIYIQDESYSSQKALGKMIEAGKNKNFRKKKENMDSFAAAVILEDFLNEN